ncbi:MAG: branched-chain amino acid ABC transporter permease [Nitriliruptorales bacterium]|nr:branched-chain amino acid ABC transporter permease [Nitriliruptorales bacterium]
MRRRPELYTSYAADMALLNTPGKRLGVGGILLLGVVMPFMVTDDILVILASACALSIGAIGLNLVTGYAGQVSLGHAFFAGLGAYTAAVLSGDPAHRTLGYGVSDMVFWLPAAGIVAGLAGLLVAPIAARLRGLYLAIVTLGLVFLGEHVFREATRITGGVGVGRPGPTPQLFGFNFRTSSEFLTGAQQTYLILLALLAILALLGRNIARGDVGRAFAAVRDRDIAAEIIGVNLMRTKLRAFTISSFYAGVAGALIYTVTPFVEPSSFNLLLSVLFVAMILIGGVATISGSIMGAFFIAILPRFTQELPRVVPFISAQPTGGGILTASQVESILYGLLIIAFLVFEPRGLFGLWLRARNYWKGWPFSY